MIHHIAIGSPNPSHLASFYRRLPEANFLKEQKYESGEVRSVWIQLGSVILMLEDGKQEAPKNLVFTLKESKRTEWKEFLASVPILHKTEYTLYFADPDGNGLGLSSYPEKLTLFSEMS